MKTTTAFGFRSVSAAAGVIVLAGSMAIASDEPKKPSISVRASPLTGFSPMRVFLTVEVKGGANDYADFYCPSVEWVWGDETRSESSGDCEPYQPGKSEIQRRYTMTRVFPSAGNYKVEFKLKQKNKVVGGGSVNVQVRPGIRDGGGPFRDGGDE